MYTEERNNYFSTGIIRHDYVECPFVEFVSYVSDRIPSTPTLFFWRHQVPWDIILGCPSSRFHYEPKPPKRKRFTQLLVTYTGAHTGIEDNHVV